MGVGRAIRSLIKQNSSEEFFVQLRSHVNVIRHFVPVSLRHRFSSVGQFIPRHDHYPSNDQHEVTRDHTKFILNRSDYVQWRIFYGVRDNALKAAKKYIDADCVVFDIGASVGAFSLKLASFVAVHQLKNVQIHCFEVNPQVFAQFKNNLERNPEALPIIVSHEFGLGDREGKKRFNFHNGNTGAGRVTLTPSEKTIEVEIQTLDAVVEKFQPKRISFIKLIVEGFEPCVLRGGWKTIEKFRPVIFMEVTPSWWSENDAHVQDVLNDLAKLGYHFQIEHFNEMLPYDPMKFSHRSQFNLLCVPRDI